jgi:hypothetical protein
LLRRNRQRWHPPQLRVRVENGKPMVMDGPFAETEEQLAGYYILDCASLDEAIEWAAKVPALVAQL